MMMLIAVVIIIIVRSHLGSSVRVACEWRLLTKHAASKLRLFLRPRRLQLGPWRSLWLGHCQAFQEIQDRDRAYIVGHRPRGRGGISGHRPGSRREPDFTGRPWRNPKPARPQDLL